MIQFVFRRKEIRMKMARILLAVEFALGCDSADSRDSPPRQTSTSSGPAKSVNSRRCGSPRKRSCLKNTATSPVDFYPGRQFRRRGAVIGRRASRHVLAAGGDLDAGVGSGHVRPARQHHGQSHLRSAKESRASRKSNVLPSAASAATPISPRAIFCSAKDSDQTPMWLCCKSAIKPIELPPSRLTMPRPRCSPRL